MAQTLYRKNGEGWACPKCGYVSPKQLIRLAELCDRTGWSRDYVEILVATGRLKTWRLRPTDKAMYFAASAQDILDGKC